MYFILHCISDQSRVISYDQSTFILKSIKWWNFQLWFSLSLSLSLSLFSIIKYVVTPLEILNLREKCNQLNHHFERHQRKPTHSHKFGPNWSIQNGPEAQSLTILFFFLVVLLIKVESYYSQSVSMFQSTKPFHWSYLWSWF